MDDSTQSALCDAARDASPVRGLTHNFYRYPARFSPTFAGRAIELFSKPGDVVLDPYMGGGTTLVEAMVAGRRAVGSDLNELSEFIARVKTRPLMPDETTEVRHWAASAVAQMHYRLDRERVRHLLDSHKTHNLHWPSARPVKKALAGAMLALEDIRSVNAQEFARCVLVRLGQWALDGRKRSPSLAAVRQRLPVLTDEMLTGLGEFAERVNAHGHDVSHPTILNLDAAKLPRHPLFSIGGVRADLVVTSPPYPGVHMLYHRWQINGRREAPAPYWLSERNDGHGFAFYNFADRRGPALDRYFDASLSTLRGIRRVMKPGAHIVQMIAFSDPKAHLPLYLENMETAGFTDAEPLSQIWRDVPGRKWHAALKGRTNSSREVVLVHRANMDRYSSSPACARPAASSGESAPR